ncbi:hypothetical protein ACFFIX_20425 [Metabacillus herbersteinensis]|uniref:PRTRC system protein B n=1 Tax=Metabacillus herbersteinensis TaxID=283816 RepID=A0ABV6GK21_9BACI
MEFLIKITDRLRNFSDCVEVIQKQANGVVLGEYKMSLNDIINSLTNSSTEGSTHETPFLPKNCVKLVSTINGHEVFIELPKRKWQITYGNDTITVGFPRMIFAYKVHGKSISKLRIIALKESGALNGETPIYYFPFANVYHTTAEVCMGGNVFPEIECLSLLEKMHYLFFAAPFNDDYGSISTETKTMKQLIESLKDKEFNDDLLMPMNTTINGFFHLSK